MRCAYFHDLPWPAVIRHMRLRSGLSQGQVTIRLGHTQQHWSLIERGNRGLSLDDFLDLCELHGEKVIVAGVELRKRKESSHEPT
jgi:predicted transcriptional regulator